MKEEIFHVKTVIIGAGIASISASINLLDNNYTDFIIFEALERIGGRICTHKTDQGYLEIGAQWIHGQVGNPIYEIARKNKLLADGFENIINDPVSYQYSSKNIDLPVEKLNSNSLLQNVNLNTENEKILFVTQNGQKISHEFAKSVYDTITKIIAHAETLNIERTTTTTDVAAAGQPISDNRVGDFLYDRFAQIVQDELGKNLFDKSSSAAVENKLTDLDLKRLLNGIFLMRAKRENIRTGCFNIFDVSLRNFSCYKQFDGHSYVELKKGYGPVIDAMIEKHNKAFYSRVRLRHFLKKIILSPDLLANNGDLYKRPNNHEKYTNNTRKAVLIICDASNPDKPKDFVVVCDNVLCTMSLGYLKENFNNIVEPLGLMSDERRQAVSRLGFGTINKIFLFYDQPFWNDIVKLINIIWLPDDENFRLDKLMHRNCTRKIWYEDVCKFEVVNSHPNAISAWIAGNVDFERLTDKEISIECTKILRRFLANQNIPEPKSIIRSKWHLNRYSRGTYSHLPLGSNPRDFDVIAQPIPSNENPIILFAGEATHRDYFSTVHGAYLTGIRESERILKINKENSRI